jgi:hypothetical protein
MARFSRLEVLNRIVELGHEFPGRQPPREGVAVPPVSAGNPVLLAQIGTNTHRHRLFAHLETDKPGHPARLAVLLRSHFELPQQHHLLVQAEAFGLSRRVGAHGLGLRHFTHSSLWRFTGYRRRALLFFAVFALFLGDD